MPKICQKCDRKVNARGLCGLHYRRAQAAGEFGTPCTVEGCEKFRVGQGLCTNHYAAKYREDNKEHYNARQREYMKNYEIKEPGKKKRKSSYKKYRLKNLSKFADKERARRGKKRANGGSFSRKDWLRLLHRFNGLCAYCSNKATTADHVVPLNKGGSNFIGNILPACISCNGSKQDKFLFMWKKEREKNGTK